MHVLRYTVFVIDSSIMIDVRQINETYHVGREKPGGKVYVMNTADTQLASYSGLTRTLEWFQKIGPDEKAIIEAYLKDNY